MIFREPEKFFTTGEKDLFKFIKSIIKTCDDTFKKEIYLYGGYIRDKILKKSSHDMDIMISENICEEFIEKLQEEYIYIDCRHHLLDEYPKKDYNLYSIRLNKPDVNLGIIEMKKSITDELKEKDFRMNSLCFDIINDKFLIDENSYFCFNDIMSNIIRCNTNLKKTFFFSPSRIFRLLRFYVCLNFKIDKKIVKYLRYKNSFKLDVFYNQSLWSQVRKLVKVLRMYPEKIYRVFKYLYAFNLLNKFQIYPDFTKKRIVFLLVEIKNATPDLIFEIIESRLIEYMDDFLVINVDVKLLTKIFFLIIASRESNNRFLQIPSSV